MRFASILLSTVLLAGCGGANFLRPSGSGLLLGTTTYEQVTEQFGRPRNSTSLTIEGVSLKAISYGYSEAVPFTTKLAVKSMKMIFKDSVLVSYDFASSFEADHQGVSSALDDDLLAKIKKGDSQNNVTALLGQPGGKAIPPVAKHSLQWRYTHLETWRIPFVPRPRIVRKVFTVSFDAAGNVVDTNTAEEKPE
jgi:hypothetical protein